LEKDNHHMKEIQLERNSEERQQVLVESHLVDNPQEQGSQQGVDNQKEVDNQQVDNQRAEGNCLVGGNS